MGGRFFHRWARIEDPGRILDPSEHFSLPWGGADHGPCDKCGGGGRTTWRCRSCQVRGADPACPSCAGVVERDERCPTCEGDGWIDRTRRRGVSVFPTMEGLRQYLLEREVDLRECVFLELEGELSDDVDLDAGSGALLVIPKVVVAVHEA